MMKKWEPWETNLRKSNNTRMLQQWDLHTQQIIKATSTQDLDPRPLTNNDHPCVLPIEMYALEPGDPPSRTLNWKPLGFLSHIKRRTNGDRFPLSVWEVWFCSTLGVPILALIGLLSGALVMRSTMTPSEITCRLAKSSLRFHRFMIGWCVGWVAF
jgi:hypothetical protein